MGIDPAITAFGLGLALVSGLSNWARWIKDGVLVPPSVEPLSNTVNDLAVIELAMASTEVELEKTLCRRLTETRSLLKDLVNLTVRNAAKLEDQTASGSRLATIDRSTDEDGQFLHTEVVNHILDK